jgi:hypothetical protein
LQQASATAMVKLKKKTVHATPDPGDFRGFEKFKLIEFGEEYKKCLQDVKLKLQSALTLAEEVIYFH